MPDRRKLAAPVLAQAASFVVVLVIGGITGHSAPPAPQPRPTTSPAQSSPAGTKGHQPGVTVEVPIVGGIVPHVPVRVLAGRTTVASGTLTPNAQDTQVEWSHALNPGTYQVCVQPPAGLHFTEKSTGALPGWDCAAAGVVAAGSQTAVIFHLAPSVP
jgi:hypothetical protein